MKPLKTIALSALLFVCTWHVSAQEHPVPLNKTDYNKPKRFAGLPGKMPLRVKDMESLLLLPVGAKVNATVATNFPLTGIIVSKSGLLDQSVKTVVIKSSNYQGATFTFTRIAEENGSFSYSGRMLNREAGDAMEITKEGETYVVRKKASHEIISE